MKRDGRIPEIDVLQMLQMNSPMCQRPIDSEGWAYLLLRKA
jgi:hypothetical protein